MSNASELYDHDYQAWAQRQIELLSAKRSIDRFPPICPYTQARILDDEFFPEQVYDESL